MRFGLAVLIMLLPALNSCLHPEAGAGRKLPLHTRLLDRGLQSDRFDPTPAATWISDIDHLKRIYERLKRSTLADARAEIPTLDFYHEAALLVEMGQKPTGGYQLEMNKELLFISNGTAEVNFSWIKPPQGTILPQVITSPWILIMVPRGGYSLITVRDQDGQIRAQVAVK
jgi:hypothetical protein